MGQDISSYQPQKRTGKVVIGPTAVNPRPVYVVDPNVMSARVERAHARQSFPNGDHNLLHRGAKAYAQLFQKQRMENLPDTRAKRDPITGRVFLGQIVVPPHKQSNSSFTRIINTRYYDMDR